MTHSLTFFSLLDLFQRLHAEAQAAIAGLSIADLDWAPLEGANSLAVLAVHICGAERYWIGDAGAGDPAGRQREQEFIARGLDEAGLARLLDESLLNISRYFEGWRAADLDEPRTLRDGRPVGLAWCIGHALEHTAQHVGQMQLTRQLIDTRSTP